MGLVSVNTGRLDLDWTARSGLRRPDLAVTGAGNLACHATSLRPPYRARRYKN
jgi:hypothetical protein